MVLRADAAEKVEQYVFDRVQPVAEMILPLTPQRWCGFSSRKHRCSRRNSAAADAAEMASHVCGVVRLAYGRDGAAG